LEGKNKMKKTLLLLSALFASQTSAQSGNPQDFFVCPPEEVVMFGLSEKTQCYLDDEPYVPPGGPWTHPVAFLYEQGKPTADIQLLFTGWTPVGGNFCTSEDFYEDGYVVAKSCAGHWPDVNLHAVDGILPMGWWGYFFGDSNTRRLALAASQAVEYGGDPDGGLTLYGFSYGGTGVILQAMLLKELEPYWGDRIEVVHSWMPHTLLVKNWPAGDQSLELAWGNSDRSVVDFVAKAQQVELKDVYFRVTGSPADSVSNFDLEFFQLCDQHKIACFGTWHNNGHAYTEPGIDLPFLDRFPGPDSGVDINSMLVIFTNSSANHWGARGHFNLGLEWDSGIFFTDTQQEVTVPLRYRPKSNMGGGIPDQPQQVTVDVTIRRIKNLDTSPGTQLSWQFGNQSGQVTTSVDGEVTISGLTMSGSESYHGLVISSDDPPPPGC
jgi:hypothetical protein